MSKTTTKAQARRARAQAAREAKVRHDARRRWVIAISAIAAVVVALVVLVVVGLASKKSPESGATTVPAPEVVVAAATKVPASTLAAVGAGGAERPPARINGEPLNSGGKPEILYVGTEWCPFCAAERWAMVVALSRFGTFNNLGATESSPSDSYPRTPTFSFHGSSYTSRYFTFTAKELESNKVVDGKHERIDTLDSAQTTLFTTTGQSAFPFVDIGGSYVLNGPQFNPEVFKGLTMAEIAARLSQPADPVAKSVLGSANVLTAAICKVTANEPADVCTAPSITAIAGQLGG